MKIHTSAFLVIISFTIIACTGKPSPESPQVQGSSPTSGHIQVSGNGAKTSIQILLQEIDQANDLCRGRPGDSPEGIAACDKRENLMQEAEKAGWCWGPQDEAGSGKRWIQCSEDPARMPKRQWYAHDINHAHCMASPSPADKIREIQEFGKSTRTRDLTAGVVEVEVDIGNGKSKVWTFYHDIESCDESLPRAKKIESKYE